MTGKAFLERVDAILLRRNAMTEETKGIIRDEANRIANGLQVWSDRVERMLAELRGYDVNA
jgi:hypothetical protein